MTSPDPQQDGKKQTVTLTLALNQLAMEYCETTGITMADFMRLSMVSALQSHFGRDYVIEKLRKTS